MPDMDRTDRRLLRELQKRGDRSIAEIAEKVGMSQAPCWRRIQKLKEQGIVKEQVVLLDREKLGLGVQVFALIKLSAHGRSNVSAFIEDVNRHEEVVQSHVIMGAYDCILQIVTHDMKSYERFFFEKLSAIVGVQEVSSMVSLWETKSTTVLPIEDNNEAPLAL